MASLPSDASVAGRDGSGDQGERAGFVDGLADDVFALGTVERSRSFGLPRLAAAGLLVVEQDAEEGLAFRAAPKAIKLRRLMKAKTLDVDLKDIDAAIRAAAHPEAEPVEDRSLGRLPGLGADDLDAAIREHGERIEQLSKPYVAIAQGLIRGQHRKL